MWQQIWGEVVILIASSSADPFWINSEKKSWKLIHLCRSYSASKLAGNFWHTLYIVRRFTCPKAGTHAATNWAPCKVILLNEITKPSCQTTALQRLGDCEVCTHSASSEDLIAFTEKLPSSHHVSLLSNSWNHCWLLVQFIHPVFRCMLAQGCSSNTIITQVKVFN